MYLVVLSGGFETISHTRRIGYECCFIYIAACSRQPCGHVQHCVWQGHLPCWLPFVCLPSMSPWIKVAHQSSFREGMNNYLDHTWLARVLGPKGNVCKVFVASLTGVPGIHPRLLPLA